MQRRNRVIKQVNNLVHLDSKRQTGYRFIEKDPVVDEVCSAIRESGMTLKWISDTSGVTVGTLINWDKGRTKRPQNITIDFVMRALGYERKWHKTK